MGRLARWLGAAFAPPAMPRSTALGLTERISSVTHLISSLEYLRRGEDRKPGGLNDWQISRQRIQSRHPRLVTVLDRVADQRVTNALHLARVAAALTLLAPVPGRARAAANLLLAGSSYLLYPRQRHGSDGTDQVAFLVQATTTVARLGERRPQLVDACLWFIALQATLSYTASGVAKLASHTWRSGEALAGVMRTLSYGDQSAWRALQRHPRAGRALGSGVLALETLYPLAYLGRGRLARPLALAAVGFHLANARLMGLGRFVWAFGSMQPAVVYTAGPARRYDATGRLSARRDDLLPVIAGGLVAGALGAGLLAQARRRALVMRPGDHAQMMTATSGNQLAYRRRGPRGREMPVLVAEAGLAATAEHWEWIAERLAARHHVITYGRAGYGPSRYLASGPYRLETSVRDLADLVRRVCPRPEQPVFLLGHSLGGYLALRAAAALPGRLAGICLLDPSHPEELRRSARQAAGERPLTETLQLLPASLRLGWGSLLARPAWVDRLPERVRERALAQYRDARLWQSGRREWHATRAEFHATDGQLPRVDVPLLLLTAQRTVEADPVQQELHDELAKLAIDAEQHTVPTDHDRMLTDATAASKVADLVAAFVARVTGGGSR